MTTLFSYKTNPAENGNCLCQRPITPPLAPIDQQPTCAGSPGMLLSELLGRDGDEDELTEEERNPWFNYDSITFYYHAYEERERYRRGYVHTAGNFGPRVMDLDE